MENVFDARAGIQKGIVQSVDDTGPVQMVTVETSPGALHTAEVLQPFGLASVPPVNGAVALLFCIGGDPANMVAILTNPTRRFGGLAHGESVLYSSGGSRVAIRNGGTVEIAGFAQVSITAPTATITATGTVTIDAPDIIIGGSTISAAGITLGAATAITGNLTVTGNIHATGTITP